MKLSIITYAVRVLLELLTPEIIKEALDLFLNVIEDAVEKSTTKIDDTVVLGLCGLLRRTLSIPDSKPSKAGK